VVSNLPDATVGDLDLQKSVKIVGAGAAATIIEWDATVVQESERDRIFHVIADAGTVNVEISGVMLTKGVTKQVIIKTGPNLGPLATTYYLRRAGGALAVGPAAAVVLVDPNVTGTANSAGRRGSRKPTESEVPGATYALKLTDVIVDGDSAQGDGGGIYPGSPLTATNTIVRNNIGSTNGGGIYNEGATSIIINSTISGNTSEGGGGFFGTGSNTVNFSGVTLSGNTAVGGGGISSRAGVTLNIVNSTISGNMGSDVGAGFYTNGWANLNFVTIAKNLAGADSPAAGSGINTFPATSGVSALKLKNVRIEGNRKGWVAGMDAAAITALLSANCGQTGNGLPVTSQGTHLSSDASCATWLNVSSDKNSIDPKIDVLANNGGATLTHKLLAGSPALGAGAADATVTLDQRGVARNATPDIGAYEEPAPVRAPVPAPVVGGGGGGGGCTVSPNAAFDPGLLGLLAAALGVLFLRRRRQGKAD
jgi:hypothetical protein